MDRLQSALNINLGLKFWRGCVWISPLERMQGVVESSGNSFRLYIWVIWRIWGIFQNKSGALVGGLRQRFFKTGVGH
jgi:hypothetical protein